MKKLKQTVWVLAGVGMVSVQAQAAESSASRLPAQQPVAMAFNQQDIQALFDQAGQPMQVAALSQTEMRETEGAFIPLAYGGLVAANYAWTLFRVSGLAAGAWRVIGPAYRGGRLLQIMHRNQPIFRLDFHKNPYASTLHYHSAPNMARHHSLWIR